MSRKVEIKYELLNKYNGHKGVLEGSGGTVNMESKADIKRSAQFTIKENQLKDINYSSDRIKPIYILNGVEYPLGVFIIASPDRKKQNQGVYKQIDCYDVCQILVEDKTTSAYYVKEGTKYVEIIRRILESANIISYDIVDSEKSVTRSREFEVGTSKLEIINTLLKEINYTNIYSDFNGMLIAKPYILPNMRSIDFGYNTKKNIILDSGVENINLFDIPNVIVGVVSNSDTTPLKSVLINDDVGNPLSTFNRGRNIVKVVNFTDVFDQETLNALIKREMFKENLTYRKYSFSSPINPLHGVENCLNITDDVLGIQGKYIETSWSMDLRVGGIMNHTCERVEYGY